MTRKELVEKLLAVGNDESEVRDMFDGDTFAIEDVQIGEVDPNGAEMINEDTILLVVVNDN